MNSAMAVAVLLAAISMSGSIGRVRVTSLKTGLFSIARRFYSRHSLPLFIRLEGEIELEQINCNWLNAIANQEVSKGEHRDRAQSWQDRYLGDGYDFSNRLQHLSSPWFDP